MLPNFISQTNPVNSTLELWARLKVQPRLFQKFTVFPFMAHPNTLDMYSTHAYWGFCAEDKARPDERSIYIWKASENVGHKSSKQIK